MNPSNEYLEALGIAKGLLELQARPSLVSRITGIPRKDLQRAFTLPRTDAGRHPSTEDWYFQKQLSKRAEASMFAAIYQRNRDNGFEATASLLDAYPRYLARVRTSPSVSIERAINIVQLLEGIWGVENKALSMTVCPRCGAWSLNSLGHEIAEPCVFCVLVDRFNRDLRLQHSFPLKSTFASTSISAATDGVTRDAKSLVF